MFINIYIPIILVSSIPFLLFFLALPPFKITPPGLRFKLTSAFILLFWTFTKLLNWNELSIPYWISGYFLIFAFIFFSFMLWSVLCWGYTICMLLSLDEYKKPVNIGEWEKLHAGAKGTEQLTSDRIQVLITLKLATYNNDILTVSKFGHHLSKASIFFMKILGIKL